MGSVDLFAQYERALKPSRKQFASVLPTLLEETRDPEYWTKFLVLYCAQGIDMTESVPHWIAGAGEATIQKGFSDIGNTLMSHARHEEGHHELFRRDAIKLVRRYNTLFGKNLVVDTLFRPLVRATGDYKELHEKTIAGSTPYCQIAIEYEIEMLSVSEGMQFIDEMTKICGADVVDCLSFITHHAAVDVGHTAMNRRLISQVFSEVDGSLLPLCFAGKEALRIFEKFVIECGEIAKTL